MTSLRIASLVPSLTELLVALGLREVLVARTGFCIHPAEALRGVPKIGGTKNVNFLKLQRLAPTHVLVNVDENRHDTVEAMKAWPCPPEIVVTHPQAPRDNLALLAQMEACFGHHPGVTEAAADLARAMREELALTCPEGRVPRKVLYLIWRAPWMTIARDTYLSGMLARVAWHSMPALVGGPSGSARYPVVRGDEPWLAEVDEVLLSSEPYRFDTAHIAEAKVLCPAATVRLVDGELLSWYGARAIPGLRYLRELAGSGPAMPGHNAAWISSSP